MSDNSWKGFWSWYVRSARPDGAVVARRRRILNAIGNLVLAAAAIALWYVLTIRIEPRLPTTLKLLFFAHPLGVLGILVAFALMSFRALSLDYMAAKLYAAKQLQLRRTPLASERKLRSAYEEAFGQDSAYKAPERLGAASIALFVVSGFGMVLLGH